MMLPVLLALLYAFVHIERAPGLRYDQAVSWRDAVRTDAARRSVQERITMPGAAWDRYAIAIDPSSGTLTIRPRWQYRIVPTARLAAAPLTTRLTKILPKSRRWRLIVLVTAASALAFATYTVLGLPLTLPLIGAARTWTHAAGNNWNAVGNWDGGATIPQIGDSVTFDATSAASCTVDVATAALIGFTVTTGYTGIITVDNAIDTDDLDVDFGGAGAWAGAAAIVLTPGGDISITSDQALPALTISPTAAAVVTFGGDIAVTGATIVNTNATVALGATAPTFTGAVTINSGGTIGKTSGTGTFTFGGGNVIVASGGLLSFTGAGQVVSCTTTVGISISAGGSLVVNGSVGSRITFSTYEYLNTAGTIDVQYADFTSGASGEYALNISGTPTITRIDNCTFTQNHASGAAGLFQQSTTVIVTCTNCTFSSTEGAAYQKQDVACSTNARLQLSSCTYTTVGLQATSGWVGSITDQGIANAHVFYGILDASAPDASYEIADADNVTVKNANVYNVSFNSVLTLDQAETVASLTTSASTTAKLNGGITFTFTTLTNNGAFEFAANTVNAAVLSGGTIGGTAPDMDSGGAGSKVTLTGVTITPAVTTGGTGVTITYTGTCVQTGAMVISTGDKVTTATATITYSSTFACTGEVESTGASSITYQDTYTANAGTEDYQAGTVTLDLGTNAYTVTSGVRKFYNMVLAGSLALTLGANNIGCAGISFVASGYTGTIGSGANNYRFDLFLTGATQTCTLGAQTWDNATAGADAIVYVIGTGSSTATIVYGGATFGANKRLVLDCNGTNQTVNLSGTVTGSGASSNIQYTSEAKTGCVYNHNAAVVTGFVNFNFDANGSATATTLNITTGTISVTTINIYDLKVVNVTDAATISCTTWTVGESAGNGATVSITAAPTLTVSTLTINALTAFTLDASFTLAPSTAFTIAATATVTVSADKTMVFGGVQPVQNGILVLSSGSILKHGGFSRASTGRVQISRTADFYNTGDLLSDPLPRVLPLAIPPTGYNQMLWEAV